MGDATKILNLSKGRARLLTAVFSLVVILLIFLSLISFRQTKKQQTTSDWVQRSFIKIQKIEEHLSLLRDVQARHRAFILSKDSTFLNEYKSLSAQLSAGGIELDSLFGDDPIQKQTLIDIHRLVQSRAANMDLALHLSESKKVEDLAPLLMDGYVVMDSLRTKVKLLETTEDHALKQRIEEKEKGDRQVLFWIMLLSLSSLVVVALAFITLKQEVHKRTKAEVESEVLDKLVNERTSEIQNINQQLKINNTVLKRKNSELNAFNFITSHDLQEPLRKIELFINYINEDEPHRISPEVKQYFDRIVVSAKRMRELIDSISIYSRYSQTQNFSSVNLNDIAELALLELKHLIKKKNANVVISTLPVINANSQQMKALFIQLINNSLKFSREGVECLIKISAEKLNTKGDYHVIWRIDFSDNGIGFDAKFTDRIFTIFQRLHDREKYSGTGIGLPICKKIAENHHGSISATSQEGTGTTISVLLPENQPTELIKE